MHPDKIVRTRYNEHIEYLIGRKQNYDLGPNKTKGLYLN